MLPICQSNNQLHWDNGLPLFDNNSHCMSLYEKEEKFSTTIIFMHACIKKVVKNWLHTLGEFVTEHTLRDVMGTFLCECWRQVWELVLAVQDMLVTLEKWQSKKPCQLDSCMLPLHLTLHFVLRGSIKPLILWNIFYEQAVHLSSWPTHSGI